MTGAGLEVTVAVRTEVNTVVHEGQPLTTVLVVIKVVTMILGPVGVAGAGTVVGPLEAVPTSL